MAQSNYLHNHQVKSHPLLNSLNVNLPHQQNEIQSKHLKSKEKKLISLMDSVLNSKFYKSEFATLFRRLNLTRDKIAQAFLDYNMDIHTHDNEIYQSQDNRMVLHVHNLIKGSWHIERQKAVCNIIKQAAPMKAIDLGFGVPSRYVNEMFNSFPLQLTLCDYAQSAFIFAEELLNIWHSSWEDRIKFHCADIEDVESCVGDYDLYISLHSIEHVTNPTKCLKEYVKLALPKALFLLEIPIGPITPEHNISWDNINQAKEWIKDVGLDIVNEHLTYVNPDVDLFAEAHGFDYSGYLMLCKKDKYR